MLRFLLFSSLCQLEMGSPGLSVPLLLVLLVVFMLPTMISAGLELEEDPSPIHDLGTNEEDVPWDLPLESPPPAPPGAATAALDDPGSAEHSGTTPVPDVDVPANADVVDQITPATSDNPPGSSPQDQPQSQPQPQPQSNPKQSARHSPKSTLGDEPIDPLALRYLSLILSLFPLSSSLILFIIAPSRTLETG